MAERFVMPKLGLTMESGTIVNWLVDDGDEVQPGQAVLVIETDKVESEVEATGAGRFHRLGEVGQEYPCGAQIGWLLQPGEAAPAGQAQTGHAPAPAPAAASSVVARAAATGVGGRLLASPNARRLAALRGVDLRGIAGTGPGGRITSEDVPERPAAANGAASSPDLPPAGAAPAPAAPVAPGPATRPLATAAARHLADLLGVDLAGVAPSGVDPRLTRDDVAAHVRALLASSAAAPTAARPTGAAPAPTGVAATGADALPAPLQEPSSIVPLTGMRGTIARRMAGSLHSMAQLTLTMDVDMDGVVADRARRRDAAGEGAPVPGYTDYVIAATAAALVEHPVVNSQITDDGVALLPRVDIGLAVALDHGLIVPVIGDAPSLGLDELAAETERLAAAARSGTLTLPELEGGTFSVTALGMYGVDAFTPIVNAPNTAILGVGRLRDDVALADGGQPVRTTRLTLSLTWDHRAFDGAPAAEFARSVKQHLEAHGPAGADQP